VAVVTSLPNKQIIFVPDKNLGHYVQKKTPDKEIITWDGFCPTHVRVQEEDILKTKQAHPHAKVVVHPECNPAVQDVADHICSTSGMLKYAKSSPAKEFIIGTEAGLLYKLRKDNPDKQFYLPTQNLICPSMKLTTLGWVAHSLEAMVYEVKVPRHLAERARITLERMLKVTGEKSGAAISGV
jgi:quinolinate synthase